MTVCFPYFKLSYLRGCNDPHLVVPSFPSPLSRNMQCVMLSNLAECSGHHTRVTQSAALIDALEARTRRYTLRTSLFHRYGRFQRPHLLLWKPFCTLSFSASVALRPVDCGTLARNLCYWRGEEAGSQFYQWDTEVNFRRSNGAFIGGLNRLSWSLCII